MTTLVNMLRLLKNWLTTAAAAKIHQAATYVFGMPNTLFPELQLFNIQMVFLSSVLNLSASQCDVIQVEE